MSNPNDPNRPRSNSLPPFMWGLIGILLVALFVLLLGVLRD